MWPTNAPHYRPMVSAFPNRSSGGMRLMLTGTMASISSEALTSSARTCCPMTLGLPCLKLLAEGVVGYSEV
jgi:hypothetical protein